MRNFIGKCFYNELVNVSKTSWADFQLNILRGILFICSTTLFNSSFVIVLKSKPFLNTLLTIPFQFSFEPLWKRHKLQFYKF
ncbi:hypothetical protein MSCb_0050 [Mycoplasma mycoides subsp. mycoides B345/93]|nr:hypothetical protein MSCb_0050 [Mycoplasma mycoides subsp. mycoides B345/93]